MLKEQVEQSEQRGSRRGCQRVTGAQVIKSFVGHCEDLMFTLSELGATTKSSRGEMISLMLEKTAGVEVGEAKQVRRLLCYFREEMMVAWARGSGLRAVRRGKILERCYR